MSVVFVWAIQEIAKLKSEINTELSIRVATVPPAITILNIPTAKINIAIPVSDISENKSRSAEFEQG